MKKKGGLKKIWIQAWIHIGNCSCCKWWVRPPQDSYKKHPWYQYCSSDRSLNQPFPAPTTLSRHNPKRPTFSYTQRQVFLATPHQVTSVDLLTISTSSGNVLQDVEDATSRPWLQARIRMSSMRGMSLKLLSACLASRPSRSSIFLMALKTFFDLGRSGRSTPP
jgi:hypothetical protein